MDKNLPKNSFPFVSKLNLNSLVQYWEDNLTSNTIFKLYPADHIIEMIKNAPELRQPIDNLQIIEKNKELVGLLMSAIMPPALVDTELTAALMPFNFQGFYATPGYQKILPFDEVRTDLITSMNGNDMEAGKIIRACLFILNKYYKADLNINEPVLVSIPNRENGLIKVYKANFNLDFADVHCKGELKPISKETIASLLEDIYNVDLWLKHIDPKNFEFQGFTICHLMEVTVEEMISSIKYDLLKKDAVTCPYSFASIQKKVRSIFQLPKMELGLSFFDMDNNVISNHGSSAWKSFVMPNENNEISCDYFIGSIYEKAHQSKRAIIVEDLEAMTGKTHIEKGLLKSGIQNVAIAPLIYEDEVIGMLELGTPYAGKLNPLSIGKMDALIPMFTAAVRRVLEDMKTEVRAIIQEECTAIHPSVEWRFLEEGYKMLSDRNRNINKATLGDITFQDVYPIYGLSDIRNSSLERNNAIQDDLKENLRLAKKVISKIGEQHKMPILGEINFKLDKEIDKISKGMNSGDETTVINFLKNEIVPTFEHFKNVDDQSKVLIDSYNSHIDPNLGVIYNKRRDFEESLTKINELISDYLEEVEIQAQEIFPHYFEKYKTDGVEYNIYLGQSLVNDKVFNNLYLNNFRLWQLITMCEIASRVDNLKASLSNPLDITQLILVHGDPLSIKFRKDEKHFDVDGAYNIRYEIVKKRIDKAFIKDTNVRLTQPGKIAIVYAQEREAEEYERYIQYLQSIDYLTTNIEYLELEELQGAYGLKALRVEVNPGASKKQFGNEVIKNVIESINAE